MKQLYKKKKKHLVQLEKQNTKYVMYEMIQSVILDLTNYFDKKRNKNEKMRKQVEHKSLRVVVRNENRKERIPT